MAWPRESYIPLSVIKENNFSGPQEKL